MKRHKLIWYVILSVSIFRCTTFNDRKLPYYLLYKTGPGFFSSRICCFSYKTQCITKIDESRVSCLHVYIWNRGMEYRADRCIAALGQFHNIYPYIQRALIKQHDKQLQGNLRAPFNYIYSLPFYLHLRLTRNPRKIRNPARRLRSYITRFLVVFRFRAYIQEFPKGGRKPSRELITVRSPLIYRHVGEFCCVANKRNYSKTKVVHCK